MGNTFLGNGLLKMSTCDRAIAYLRKCPPAISGSGGHNATLRAACECVRFGLSDIEMWDAMSWYNENRCQPIWTEKELRHKIDTAKQKGTFGERAPNAYRPKATIAKPVTCADLASFVAARRPPRMPTL